MTQLCAAQGERKRGTGKVTAQFLRDLASVDTHPSSSSALRPQRAQLAFRAPSLCISCCRSNVIAATNSRIWSSMETAENRPDKPRHYKQARSSISEIRDTDGIGNTTPIFCRGSYMCMASNRLRLRDCASCGHKSRLKASQDGITRRACMRS